MGIPLLLAYPGGWQAACTNDFSNNHCVCTDAKYASHVLSGNARKKLIGPFSGQALGTDRGISRTRARDDRRESQDGEQGSHYSR